MLVFALTGDLEKPWPSLLPSLGLALFGLAPLSSLLLLLPLLLLLLLLFLLLLLMLVLAHPAIGFGLELVDFFEPFVPTLPGTHPGILKLDFGSIAVTYFTLGPNNFIPG